MSASAVAPQVGSVVGGAPQPTTYAAPAQQYSLPQAAVGSSVIGQQPVYMTPQASAATYAAAPPATYSLPAGTTTYATTAQVPTVTHTADSLPQHMAQQVAYPSPTYAYGQHMQVQHPADVAASYPGGAMYTHPYVASPHTQQYSLPQQAATHEAPLSYAAPQPTMVHQQADVGMAPITYATHTGQAQPTMVHQQPEMVMSYQHQQPELYHQPMQQIQHPYQLQHAHLATQQQFGLPTAPSMVAYPVGAGMTHTPMAPQQMQPEAAASVHAAAPPTDAAAETASASVAKTEAPPSGAKKSSVKKTKVSKKKKKGCC